MQRSGVEAILKCKFCWAENFEPKFDVIYNRTQAWSHF